MSFAHEAGKGSRRRSSEDQKKFEDNYERIFGKKDRKEKDENSKQKHS